LASARCPSASVRSRSHVKAHSFPRTQITRWHLPSDELICQRKLILLVPACFANQGDLFFFCVQRLRSSGSTNETAPVLKSVFQFITHLQPTNVFSLFFFLFFLERTRHQTAIEAQSIFAERVENCTAVSLASSLCVHFGALWICLLPNTERFDRRSVAYQVTHFSQGPL
jgi:hypothetical protein